MGNARAASETGGELREYVVRRLRTTDCKRTRSNSTVCAFAPPKKIREISKVDLSLGYLVNPMRLRFRDSIIVVFDSSSSYLEGRWSGFYGGVSFLDLPYNPKSGLPGMHALVRGAVSSPVVQRHT